MIIGGVHFTVVVVEIQFNSFEISVGGDNCEQEETNKNKETWQNRCTAPRLFISLEIYGALPEQSPDVSQSQTIIFKIHPGPNTLIRVFGRHSLQ